MTRLRRASTVASLLIVMLVGPVVASKRPVPQPARHPAPIVIPVDRGPE